MHAQMVGTALALARLACDTGKCIDRLAGGKSESIILLRAIFVKYIFRQYMVVLF